MNVDLKRDSGATVEQVVELLHEITALRARVRELEEGLREIVNEWNEGEPADEYRPGRWSPQGCIIEAETINHARALLTKEQI